jgi:hypothetical protein
MALLTVDYSSVWKLEGGLSGPELRVDMVEDAERALGVRLPAAYLAMLRVQNGGLLRKCRFDTSFPTSWADDHFEIEAVSGIGGTEGIDAAVGGSRYLIEEWGYPAIGVVFAVCPSAGHDTVMLDYTRLGKDGEATVAYIDEDRVPRTIAASFEDFVTRLR